MYIKANLKQIFRFATLLIVISPGIVFAKTLYVSSSDSRAKDSNSGLADTAPLAGIERAVDLANPGDNILLKGGDRWAISNRVIIKDSDISVGTYGSTDYAVLDGRGVAPRLESDGLLVLDGNRLSIRNIELRDSNGKAVHIRGDGVKVTNVRTISPATAGIIVDRSDGVEIRDCTVLHSNTKYGLTKKGGWGGGIVLKAATNFKVIGNSVLEGWGEGIMPWLGADRGTISNNLVYAHHAVGIYVNAKNVDIFNNVVLGTSNSKYWRHDNVVGAGIALNNEALYYEDESWGLSDLDMTSNVNIYDNVVAGTYAGVGIFGAYQNTHYKNINILHNTFVDNMYQFTAASNVEHTNTRIANNIFLSISSGNSDIGGGLEGAGVIWQSNNWTQIPKRIKMKSSTDVIGGAILSKMSGWKNISSSTSVDRSDFKPVAKSSTLNSASIFSLRSYFNGSIPSDRDMGAIFDSLGQVSGESLAPLPPASVKIY